MKNWNIGKRITGGFAAVILITATLGAYAFWHLHAISGKTDVMTKDALPSILTISSIESNARENYAQVLMHVISETEAEKTRVEELMQRASLMNAESLKHYEGMVSGARDRELFEAVKNRAIPIHRHPRDDSCTEP